MHKLPDWLWIVRLSCLTFVSYFLYCFYLPAFFFLLRLNFAYCFKQVRIKRTSQQSCAWYCIYSISNERCVQSKSKCCTSDSCEKNSWVFEGYVLSQLGTLIGFSDADWAGDQDDRSMTGNVFSLSGGAVSWFIKKQATVSLLTAKAVYE